MTLYIPSEVLYNDHMDTAQPLPLALCDSITSLTKLDLQHYVMEPKLDGFRLQAIVTDKVSLFTRSQKSATGKMPAVEGALRMLPAGTILDGEAVFLDPKTGAADFNQTARIMGSGTDKAVQKQRIAGNVSYVVFDLLFLAGEDIRDLPLYARRALLEQVVEALSCPLIVATEQTTPTPEQHKFYTDFYGEGSVVKDRRAAYPSGRSKAMLKWKKCLDADVVVMGATEGKGKYTGMVGAIIYGQYKDGVLTERGQCSGVTDAQRRAFTDNLPLGTVMEITHNGVQALGAFRHPQFNRIRTDKNAEDCTWE